MQVEDVKKLTVEKLKVELKARDLDTSGKKAELAERLESHLQAQPTASGDQANIASSSATAPDSSAEPVAAKVRKPIVWSAAAPAPAETSAAAVPADAPVTEASAPAEVSEADKQKARALKFGISTEKVDTTAKELGKRKLEDVETAALVSDDMIAKRRERFTSQLDKDQAKKLQDRQQRFNPDAGKDAEKQAERKERFQKWLPSGGSSAPGMSKPANANVAAALGTSLDNSIKGGLTKGHKGKPNSNLLSTENFSDEFKAKAEARKARFAAKA